MLRSSFGATKRANSVLPLRPEEEPEHLVQRAEEFFAARDLPTVFQIPSQGFEVLDGYLAAQGFDSVGRTVIAYAPTASVSAGAEHARVRVSRSVECAADWFDCYVGVDGRAEYAAEVKLILERTPSLYLSAALPSGVAGTARLTVIDDVAVLSCMAVRPEARRQGIARALIGAALDAAQERDVVAIGLQIVESNTPARALYAAAGFAEVDGYHYRVR
ncbi:GNAT family N-acetyltransferase [Agromyces atrinae]|nr:GNAT family N-acetyltransferase [Agromyces atrinae]MCI2958679.1 GNAT family N-acetyltransferase [Agromyces atrinae]